MSGARPVAGRLGPSGAESEVGPLRAQQGRLWGVRGAIALRGMDRFHRLYILLVSRRLGFIAS
jgi:hypothetical protein